MKFPILTTVVALNLTALAHAQTAVEDAGNAVDKAGQRVSQVGHEIANQTPRQTPLVDNGGLFIELGSQSMKIDGDHTDAPLYGVGADLNALSWKTSAGVFQLGGNFDVQFMRGKAGGHNIRANTLSAGPTVCYWFLGNTSFCLEGDVSNMNITQDVTYHLGTIRGGASFRQRLSDQYMAKLSYEGGSYSTSGKDVSTNNILLAVSWRPLSQEK